MTTVVLSGLEIYESGICPVSGFQLLARLLPAGFQTGCRIHHFSNFCLSAIPFGSKEELKGTVQQAVFSSRVSAPPGIPRRKFLNR